jgi:mono/diheme cytochrome c family protein
VSQVPTWLIATSVLVAGGLTPARESQQPSPEGPTASKTVWTGVYSDAQASRGQVAYSGNCASCHLETLLGNDLAPALVGAAFIGEWDKKTVRQLYGRILSTMPADAPGTLDEKVVLDIVAYIFRVNGFPAGQQDLETADQAEQIVLARAK